jgi:hypothetical protein
MAALIEMRTHKQPLPTTEMTRASHRENVLIEIADFGCATSPHQCRSGQR